MSACATQTFTGVTQARVDCVVQEAKNAGVTITGNVRQVSHDGITIRWLFNPGTQVLEIQCTDAPFYLPCGTINAKIHDLVDECP